MSTVKSPSNAQDSQSIGDWLSRHWFALFLTVYGLWVFTPFLAPFFMHIGWTGAGKAIYFIYSFFCHQLPERSFFLFGGKTMFSLNEIQAVWQDTINPMILRQFVGNETMGWKVAWSDRMISFYTSVWVFAALWFPFRRKIKTLSWFGFILLLLPLIMDGATHMLSDFAGIGRGFRDTNQWLAILTNNSFPATFYAGDGLGSFNSRMRFITGLLAGLGIVWLAFPYIFQTQAYNFGIAYKAGNYDSTRSRWHIRVQRQNLNSVQRIPFPQLLVMTEKVCYRQFCLLGLPPSGGDKHSPADGCN